MADRDSPSPPQAYARFGGLFYLYIIAVGVFAEVFVRSRLVIAGDAEATAANIMASEGLFRMTIAGELLLLVCDVALALILYVLLRPVDRNLALAAAFFRLVMTAISGVNAVNLLSVLTVLSGADDLSGPDAMDARANALLLFNTHAATFGVALIFFGFHCLLIGYLIFRAGYLPKWIGFLLVIAGLGYLANSFANIASPALADYLFPYVLLPAFIAELSLALWLLIAGVNGRRWRERIGAA